MQGQNVDPIRKVVSVDAEVFPNQDQGLEFQDLIG